MIYSNNALLTRPQVRPNGRKFGAETITSDVVASDSSSATEGTHGPSGLFSSPEMPYMNRTSPLFPDSSACNLAIPTEKSTIDQADLDQL